MKFLFEDELPGQVDIFTIQNEISSEELYNKIKDKDNIESWFEVLVPSEGKADTVAGELVRAMMRLLYRDYNDGDRFFSGYGVETCGGSAQFLIENTNDWISNKLIDIAEDDLRDDAYTDGLNEITLGLITFLKNNKELLSKPNEEDSRDWELDEQFIPKYDFDCEIPPYIQDLIDSGKYTEEDLQSEIYYWEPDGGEIGRLADRISVNGDIIYIEGIPEDMYNELERNMYRWLEDFAEDLYNEYGDPDDWDDEDNDEDDYLDEALENAKYGIIETKKFNNKNFKSFRPVETLEDAKWQKDSLEKVDKIPYTIFTIEDKKKVEESLHNDEIEQHKKLTKEIGVKTLGDLKSFKDHQGSAELDALKDYKKELDLDEALGLKERKFNKREKNALKENYASWLCKYWPDDKEDRAQLDRKLRYLNLKKELAGEDAVIKGDKENIKKFMIWLGLTDNRFSEIKEESLKEDTVKQNGKWVNKGKEGTHGTFKTKKAADAQRKAMFANGFKEDFNESLNESSYKELKSIKIPGYRNTWSEIDRAIVDFGSHKSDYRLMENDEYGDETCYLVITPDFKNIYETFDNIEDCLRDEFPGEELSIEYPDELNESLNESIDEDEYFEKLKPEIKEIAEGDWEVGHIFDPDDFNEFAHIIISDEPELGKFEDGKLKLYYPDLLHRLFDYYYECLDEIRSEEYYNKYDEEDNYWDKYDEEDESDLDEKLIQGKSDATLKKNIKTEIEAGKDPKQAYAIAKSIQDKHKNEKLEEALKDIKEVKRKLDLFPNQITVNKELADEVKELLQVRNISFMIDDHITADGKEGDRFTFKLKFPTNKKLNEDDEADYFNGEDTISDKDIEELDKDIDDLKAFADKVMKENIKPLNINNTNEEVTPIYENSNVVMEDIDDEVIVDYVNENITEKAGE